MLNFYRKETKMFYLTKLFLTFIILTAAAYADEQKSSVPNVEKSSFLPSGDREILWQLEEPFLCDFKTEMPLGKTLTHIAQTTKTNLMVDFSSLKKIGVTAETPVKLCLPFPLPLRDVLDYLAKQHDLAWMVKDEVLVITTCEKSKGQSYKETYYVGDLLRTSPEHSAIPFADSPEGRQENVLFTPLVDYIRTMVAPESWQEKGGDGEISEYYPTLSIIVRQQEEQHKEIVQLLKRLRAITEVQIMFECAVLTGADGIKKSHRVICFNGYEGKFDKEWKKGNVLYIAPISSEAIPDTLAAANKPFLIDAPEEDKAVTVKGVALSGNVIKTTVTVEGQEPETRFFYAVPFRQTETEFAPLKSQSTPKNKDHIPLENEEKLSSLDEPFLQNGDKPASFADFLQQIKEQTGMEITADYPTLLRDANVTAETPVSLFQTGKEIKLKSVLNVVLEQLGLGYFVENGVLQITSIPAAKSKRIFAMYNVTDIVGDKEDESLIDLVKAVAHSDSWEKGTVIQFAGNGKLVVLQTREVHRAITDLLQQLHRIAMKTPTPATRQ